MINPVIIKGNSQGIRLIISPEANFDVIINELKSRLRNTKHYYRNVKPISIAFDGKELTDDEKNIIINTLIDIGLNVKLNKPKAQKKKVKPFNLPQDEDGLFYVGNLKNGQSIEACKSIIVLGNVEQGAEIFSEGNIIILGYLGGYAKSGFKGRKNTFVYSLMTDVSSFYRRT